MSKLVVAGRKQSQDDSGSDTQPRRARPKNLLLRAKSDFGPRGDTSTEESPERDNQDWGARHGFEDHYQSEEYVSQLANVCVYVDKCI